MSTLLWHNELNNKQIYDDVEKNYYQHNYGDNYNYYDGTK
jgi:hypothetical protein